MDTRRLLTVVVLALPWSSVLAQRPGAWLGELTWPDAERRIREAPLVIVPFGAGAKEHGPHLPLATDHIVLEHLLQVAMDSLPVVVTTARVPTLVVSWNDLETTETGRLAEQRAGGHADEIETSIVLALRPELVHMDRAVTDSGAPSVAMPGYRPGNFSRRPGDPEYATTGIFGDARLATADKGRRALTIMRTEWLKALRAFATVPAS